MPGQEQISSQVNALKKVGQVLTEVVYEVLFSKQETRVGMIEIDLTREAKQHKECVTKMKVCYLKTQKVNISDPRQH